MLLGLAIMGYAGATEAGYHGVCWCYRGWLPWGILVLLRLATLGCAGATKTGHHGVCWYY